MSDLQCPATMLIARHGEMTKCGGRQRFPDGGALTHNDTFTDSGTLTDMGRRQVHRLVEHLAGQPVLPHCALAEVEVDADGWRVVAER